MTDKGVVLRKLASIREHVLRLRRRRPASIEALRDDVDRQDAIAMSLLVAVQEAMDIGLHLASDLGWGVPASYAETFELLARNGVIDSALASRLANMAALRNRLAHGYASVDLARVWHELPDGIDALERYAAAIAASI